MPKKQQEESTRRQRRTVDQQIADLTAKILAIREREARKQAKADPAMRFIAQAVKAIDKALEATEDAPTKRRLNDARATLDELMLGGAEDGLTNGTVAPQPPRSPRVNKDELGEALIAYVRTNPDQRGEQIAAALGTDTNTMRPVMKKLIAAKKIRTEGQRRGMTYAAV